MGAHRPTRRLHYRDVMCRTRACFALNSSFWPAAHHMLHARRRRRRAPPAHRVGKVAVKLRLAE